MIVTNLILVLSLIILGVQFYKVKKAEQKRKARRMELELLGERLIGIQISLLMARKAEDKFFFEIEIAKYLKDYLLGCLTDKWTSGHGITYAHPYLVLKYSDLFQIFEMDDSEKQLLEHALWHIRKEADAWEVQNEQTVLESRYFMWREKSEHDQSQTWETDCAYESARIEFSKEHGLEETVPFEVMFMYEKHYNDSKKVPQLAPHVQMSGSFIITDPKGGLFRDISFFLKQNGYDIRTKELTPERTETEAEDRNQGLSEAPKCRPGRRR